MRDFRDAKAMAHTLRDALKAKVIETTHSECLELITERANPRRNKNLSGPVRALSGSRSQKRRSRRAPRAWFAYPCFPRLVDPQGYEGTGEAHH